MSRMTDKQIAEIEAAYEAADYGEWTSLPLGKNHATSKKETIPARVRTVSRDKEGRRCTRYIAVCDSTGTDNDANADFIAVAHTAIPELLAELKDVRRQERKACIALINMSGKVKGDGMKEMLASIKIAEAELAKEDDALPTEIKDKNG